MEARVAAVRGDIEATANRIEGASSKYQITTAIIALITAFAVFLIAMQVVDVTTALSFAAAAGVYVATVAFFNFRWNYARRELAGLRWRVERVIPYPGLRVLD